MFEILFLLISNIIIFVLLFGISLFIVPINIMRRIFMKFNVDEYLYNLLKSFDQLGGAMLYGTEDFTISSWTYHLHTKGNIYATYFMKFIDTLALGVSYVLYKLGTLSKEDYEWNKNHCKNSFNDEVDALYKKSKTFKKENIQ